MHLVRQKASLLFILLLALLFNTGIDLQNSFAQTTATSVTDKHFNILLLNSYDPDNPWTKSQESSILSGINNANGQVKVFREYMDSKRVYGDAYDLAYQAYLKSKYHDTAFNLVVTTDDYATNFAAKYKDTFTAKDTPVIFSGMNDLNFKANNFVGVYEKVNISDTVGLIKKLQGNKTPVMIVTDKSLSSKSIIDTSLNDAKWMKENHVSLLQSNNLSEIGLKLSSMREGAIIFLLFNEDSTGKRYTYFEGLSEIKKYSDLPVYVVWDFYLGQQVVGGVCITQKEMGESLSALINRIVAGDPVESLNSSMSEALPVVDYNISLKYGLYNAAKTAKVNIIGEPESFLAAYAQLIMLSFTLSLVFIVIIGLLINNIRQKNKYYDVVGEYKSEMMQTHQRLEKKLTESSQQIDMLLKDQEHYIKLIMDLKRKASLLDRLPVLFNDMSLSMSTIHAYLSELEVQGRKLIKNDAGHTAETITSEISQLIESTSEASEIQIQFVNKQLDALRLSLTDLTDLQARNFKPLNYTDAFWTLVLPTLKKRQVRLLQNIPEDFHLYGSPGDFITLLMILIGNGVKHGYCVNPERPLHMELEIFGSANHTHIVYRDDGNGCPTNQLENAINRKLDGSVLESGGVGLYMLGHIVQDKFKGQIHVSGDINQGIQVRIIIPRAGE